MTYKNTFLAMALACGVATSASAATFTEQSGFATTPATGAGFTACKTLTRTGSFTTGTLLGAANVSGGCVGYFGVSLNTTAKTITFTGLQDGNYTYGFFEAAGITEGVITGLSTVSYAGLFSDQPLAPQLSFTGSSLRIVFQDAGQFVYQTGGQAVFAYTSEATAAVPEPATWALMVLGFGGIGYSMRRRSKVNSRIRFA